MISQVVDNQSGQYFHLSDADVLEWGIASRHYEMRKSSSNRGFHVSWLILLAVGLSWTVFQTKWVSLDKSGRCLPSGVVRGKECNFSELIYLLRICLNSQAREKFQ